MPKDPIIKQAHYSSRFLKKFTKLPKQIRELYAEKEKLFFVNPYNPLLKTHKLTGTLSQFYAFSVNYKYRSLFRFVKDDEVLLYDIGTHEIYR